MTYRYSSLVRVVQSILKADWSSRTPLEASWCLPDLIIGRSISAAWTYLSFCNGLKFALACWIHAFNDSHCYQKRCKFPHDLNFLLIFFAIIEVITTFAHSFIKSWSLSTVALTVLTTYRLQETMHSDRTAGMQAKSCPLWSFKEEVSDRVSCAFQMEININNIR